MTISILSWLRLEAQCVAGADAEDCHDHVHLLYTDGLGGLVWDRGEGCSACCHDHVVVVFDPVVRSDEDIAE